MGELSRADACGKRDRYVTILNEIKASLDKEFADMDFENADKRTVMQEYIETMKAECDTRISELEGMSFS